MHTCQKAERLIFGPEFAPTALELRLDEKVDNSRTLYSSGNNINGSGLSEKRENTRGNCYSRKESCDSQWTRGMVSGRRKRHPHSDIGGLGSVNRQGKWDT